MFGNAIKSIGLFFATIGPAAGDGAQSLAQQVISACYNGSTPVHSKECNIAQATNNAVMIGAGALMLTAFALMCARRRGTTPMIEQVQPWVQLKPSRLRKSE